MSLVDESWPALTAPTGALSWRVEFLTPVAFREGSRTTPFPAVPSLIQSASSRWSAWSPTALPSERNDAHALWISDLDLRSEALKMSGRVVSASTGHLRLRTEERQVAARVDPWLRLAAYGGLGSFGTRGLGVVRVTPELAPREA